MYKLISYDHLNSKYDDKCRSNNNASRFSGSLSDLKVNTMTSYIIVDFDVFLLILFFLFVLWHKWLSKVYRTTPLDRIRMFAFCYCYRLEYIVLQVRALTRWNYFWGHLKSFLVIYRQNFILNNFYDSFFMSFDFMDVWKFILWYVVAF